MGGVSQPPDFARYGGGFIDYTDNDYVAGTYLSLVDGVSMMITRDLSASPANTKLNSPFDAWQPWDNNAKKVRARALYDTFGVRIALRVVPDKIGGVVRVSLVTPTVELAGKNMLLTAYPGTEEMVSVDYPALAVRSSFAANGAQFMLTSTVPITVREFSPEFYPLGYQP